MWIFLSQETIIPAIWKPVFQSGNRHWLAWLQFIRNWTNVKPRAALRGASRLYISEISCIMHNCQSVSWSPDSMDSETGIFTMNIDNFINHLLLVIRRLTVHFCVAFRNTVDDLPGNYCKRWRKSEKVLSIKKGKILWELLSEFKVVTLAETMSQLVTKLVPSALVRC